MGHAKKLGIAGAFALTLLVAPAAWAAPHVHDGFYLEPQLGFGYMTTTAEAGGIEVKYSGMTVATGLLIGGSPMEGLAIGGGFITDQSTGPSVSVNGQDLGSDADVSLYLIGMGMFGDFYPDPTDGLHFQLFFGWGGLEATYQGDAGGSDPTGLVMSLAGGYEWWIASEWSIGVLGRIAYAPLSLDDIDYPTWAPAILASFTFH
jgi:hypothetical protein